MSTPRHEDSLLEFPCRFPIKVMGRAEPLFETEIVALVRELAPDLADVDVSRRLSQAGNYVSLTLTVTALSREQLDDIYRRLTAHNNVLMAL